LDVRIFSSSTRIRELKPMERDKAFVKIKTPPPALTPTNGLNSIQVGCGSAFLPNSGGRTVEKAISWLIAVYNTAGQICAKEDKE